MGKKIIIIGGVAGGASAATRCRRLDEHAEIIIFERGPHPSYSNCCLPNYLSREIEDSEDLVVMTPEKFKASYNIDVRVLHEVMQIHPERQAIVGKNLVTGESFEEAYDDLILATGSSAIMPGSIDGIDREHVFCLKDIPDLEAIDEYLRTHDAKHVVVVGGGFIGLEVMENLRLADFEVTLIEGMNQVMAPLDLDMAQTLHKVIYDQGVELILDDTVEAIGEDSVTLKSGRSIKTDAVIMGIGVTPNTQLAKTAGIEIGSTGGVKVNHNYQTNIPHIYAVGDVIETHHFLTRQQTRLALAGPAQRQGRACANAIYGKSTVNKGVVGSMVLRLFDYNCASTGLNEKDCERLGIEYMYSYVVPEDKVKLMPDAHPLFFKLIFQNPSGLILGAQAIGKGAVDKRIDVISTLIQLNGTLYDLLDLELTYAPPFSQARDVVNMAALVGTNLLEGEFEQLPLNRLREEIEKGSCFIDVRPPDGYANGHLKGAINIPLGQLRSRLAEVPRNVPVFLYCQTTRSAYNALRILQGNGYTNAKTCVGSMLAFSMHEYFEDQVTDRESILTGYLFK